jgi:putative transposase
MYRYRRMNREQRKAIVAARRDKCFPLHKPAHSGQDPGWYFITAACYEHRHHFQAPQELTALSQRLLEGFQNAELPVGGWVVMPNHYHLLVDVAVVKQVGSIVGPIHGKSARYANKRDRASGRRVWFKYADRKVRSDRHYWTCIHYMITNPVKHRFCETPNEWPWSCYHELIAEHGDEWIDSLKRDFPLLNFGSTWDEF